VQDLKLLVLLSDYRLFKKDPSVMWS